MDVRWAHLGNNFTLDFHEDSLTDVQPQLETTTGVYGRSFQQSVFLRPTNSVDVNINYFLPSAWAATTRSRSAIAGAPRTRSA